MARTKEELKALIEKMTYENTSHALEQEILLEMLEQMGGVTIDLNGYELAEESIDVTDAIPTGWMPKSTDYILYDDQILYFMSGISYGFSKDGVWVFGIDYGAGATVTQIKIEKNGASYTAEYKEI